MRRTLSIIMLSAVLLPGVTAAAAREDGVRVIGFDADSPISAVYDKPESLQSYRKRPVPSWACPTGRKDFGVLEWSSQTVNASDAGKDVTFILACGFYDSRGYGDMELLFNGTQIAAFNTEPADDPIIRTWQTKQSTVRFYSIAVDPRFRIHDGLMYVTVPPSLIAFGKPQRFMLRGKKDSGNTAIYLQKETIDIDSDPISLQSQIREIVRTDDAAKAKRESDILARHAEDYRRWWSDACNVRTVDVLESIIDTRMPNAVPEAAIHAPRNAPIFIKLAVHTSNRSTLRFGITPLNGSGGTLAVRQQWFFLRPVVVEANYNGCSKTAAGKNPPKVWMDHLVAKAPYSTSEVLVPSEALETVPGDFSGMLLRLFIPRSTKPGEYSGRIVVSGAAADGPTLRVIVHSSVLPDDLSVSSTHWVLPDPFELTRRSTIQWWSDEHWKAVDYTFRTLRETGQDHVYTPLFTSKDPLIQIIEGPQSSYSFDFSRFIRWVELAKRCGIRYIEGSHLKEVFSGGWILGKIYVRDARSGELREKSFEPEEKVDGDEKYSNYLQFLGKNLLPALYDCLRTNDLLDRYRQHLYDEAPSVELYLRFSSVVKPALPGIAVIDAYNRGSWNESVQWIDVLVTQPQILDANRNALPPGKTCWLYSCCNPSPPVPNRHLDRPLFDNRLYPWMVEFYGGSGYLNWGGNIYRGADPYASSIGPLPNGSQKPGHPPGDNWFYYPSSNGLLSSLRMITFYEGQIDVELLRMLKTKDAARAEKIVRRIYRGLTDYADDPAAYHDARRDVLAALDGQ